MRSRHSTFTVSLAALTALFLVASANADETEAGAKPGGYLGVMVGAGQFDVLRVLPSSAAADAGLRVGDKIFAIDDQRVQSLGDLADRLAARRPGDTVRITIQRGDEHLKVNATLTARPEKQALPAEGTATEEEPVAPEIAPEAKKKPGFLGVQIDPIPELLAAHLQLEKGVGVLVVRVLEGSPAARVGVQKDDILLELDGKPIANRRFLQKKLEGDPIKLTTLRRGVRESVDVELGAQPPSLAADPGAIAPPDEETAKWLGRLNLPSIRGKLYFKRDGKEEVFEIPELDLERAGEEFDRALAKELGQLPAEIESRVDKLLKALHEEKAQLFSQLELEDCLLNRLQFEKDFCRRFKEQLKQFDLDWECPLEFKHSGRSSFLLRSSDVHHVMTVSREKGVDKITVEDHKGNVLADKISSEEVKKLPPDVQKKIQSVLENLDRLSPKIKEAEKADPKLDKSDKKDKTKRRTIKI